MDTRLSETVGLQPSELRRLFLVLVPPYVGLLVSCASVLSGPKTWWANWLIVGMVWGVTLPLRYAIRAALEKLAPEFTLRNSGVIRSAWHELRELLREWRRAPIEEQLATAFYFAGFSLAWPVIVVWGIYEFWKNERS